ncbi:MAG: hypothetical protein GX154_04985 [Clostridiales bacterium]|nr:hypothetical protein [Clostridiales bacterium]
MLNLKSINSNFEDINIETAAFLETDKYESNVEALNTYQKEKALTLYEDYIKKIIINSVSRELKVDENNISVQIKTDDKTAPGFGMAQQVHITINDKVSNTDVESVKKVHILDSKKVINEDEKEYNFNEKTYTEDVKNVITKLLPIGKDSIKIDFTVSNGGDLD